ncbi:ribosomal protein S18-alanine N-acetyltransferase [Pleurocapsa sp. FMAR1]|uniref:ribosomal protein S18-alanine N-acetyltransferase n=1 Tax=Pleurocapsa sp. FMAR1 TaxID=3040204 RepID=UPI0029C84481|nr:ribosomal protein S18-alanine N-acetyltransferase [Pleurocapsa sp. FMAR1]
MKILKIAAITVPQVPKIVNLDRLCLGGLWTAEAYLREIDSPNSDLIALHLAEDEAETTHSKIIGLACLWAIVEEAHITSLGVDPEYRRQGFGQLLLLTLLAKAISLKLERATLEVNVNNSQAINLYQKFGFQVAGKRKNYYQKTGDDALILWRNKIQSDNFQLSLSQWQQNLGDRLRHNQCQLN